MEDSGVRKEPPNQSIDHSSHLDFDLAPPTFNDPIRHTDPNHKPLITFQLDHN